MKPGKIILSFLLVCFAFSSVAADDRLLILNNPTSPPFTMADGTGYMDRLYHEAFKRLGYRIKLVSLPAERALRSVDDGVVDGDISRIAGLEEKYPNLVRVPTKIIDMNFIAFTRKPVNQDADWKSLAGSEVGYIKGWKIFEANVPSDTHLLALRDHQQMFDMFRRDRLEIILYSQYMGLYYAKLNKIDNVYPWLPPLARKEMFLYLNKKHKSLGPKLVNVINEMKREGLVSRLYKETFEVLQK